ARSGLSVRGISDLERGARQAPRPETVRLLADALALTDQDRKALLAAARPQIGQEPSATPQSSMLISLPTPLTRLIAREIEGETVKAMLAGEEARLVPVAGVGGTGKTRLAIAVAGELVSAYPDGIVFVDLSALTDPALVVPTMASALGAQEVARQSLRDSLA